MNSQDIPHVLKGARLFIKRVSMLHSGTLQKKTHQFPTSNGSRERVLGQGNLVINNIIDPVISSMGHGSNKENNGLVLGQRWEVLRQLYS